MSTLCRITVKSITDGIATICFIDLEHSKSWVIPIAEKHDIFAKIGEHGLFTTDCTVLHGEYVYSDLPELNAIIKIKQKRLAIVQALIIAPMIVVVIFVAIYITNQIQLLMR